MLHMSRTVVVRPGGDDVIVRRVLLQHQPHRLDIVARVAPVALGVDVAEPQLAGEAKLDAGDAIGHLAGNELDASQRRFVVEQDAARSVKAEALAVVDRDPVAVEFGYRIRRARIERRRLRLNRLAV